MSVNFTVDISRMVDKLAKRTAAAKDTRPLMKVVAGIMMDSTASNFEQHGRPAWDPLKESTIEQREKKGYGSENILIRKGNSGGLLGSIHEKYNATEAVVGTNLEYARIHQKGGVINQGARSETFQRSRYKRGAKKGAFKKGKGTAGQGMSFKAKSIKIPPRPFLKLQPDEKINILQKIHEHMTGKKV